ncbi:MAG: hypothetical protein A3F16_06340 [Deltaproteobacteria bacterium RIFCSPHIGHO2_12_FULL_43_9]|nr:MAG: hypothetical protein A3F16_06340 [Deltaproteobacteria bacterium RIFCSPHIGHO2_12_FULL_43_9]
MARVPRKSQIYDGESFHLFWKCHNNNFLLEDDYIKRYFYKLLLKYSQKYNVKIHSYSILSNHPHIFGTLGKLNLFSQFQRVTNSMLAKEINENSSRVGQVVLDRYKIIPVREVEQQLSVMLYLDMNAVKAGLAGHPKYYKWSSYNYYAFGVHDPLLTPSPYYLALSGVQEKRMAIYRELIECKLIELKKWNVAKKQSSREDSNETLIKLL